MYRFLCGHMFSISLWYIPRSRISWSHDNFMFNFLGNCGWPVIHLLRSFTPPHFLLETHPSVATKGPHLRPLHCWVSLWTWLLGKMRGHQLQARRETIAGASRNNLQEDFVCFPPAIPPPPILAKASRPLMQCYCDWTSGFYVSSCLHPCTLNFHLNTACWAQCA